MPKRDKSKGLPKDPEIPEIDGEEEGINYPALIFLIIALLANIFILLYLFW